MAYVCLNCGDEYNVGYLKSINDSFICPNKHCNTKLEDIDDMLLPIILFLHSNGFCVKDCCSGHLNNKESQSIETYIVISRYINGLYTTKGFVERLLAFIDKSAEIVYNDKEISIYFRSNDLKLEDAYYKVSENCLILLKWCNEIVGPLCKELDSSWCEGEEVSEDMDRGADFEEDNIGIID